MQNSTLKCFADVFKTQLRSQNSGQQSQPLAPQHKNRRSGKGKKQERINKIGDNKKSPSQEKKNCDSANNS